MLQQMIKKVGKVVINVNDIKKLRNETLAAMIHCKNALEESDGDFDKAKEYLKIKGLSIANKKSNRDAFDGLVAAATLEEDEGQSCGVLVELNSETDFVARNNKFQALLRNISNVALKNNIKSIDELKVTKIFNNTVEEEIVNHITILGEKIALSNFASLSVKEGVVSSYVHNEVAPKLGKVAVLVSIQSSGDKMILSELGKKIAMHIVANRPLAVSIEQLPSELIIKEKKLIEEQIAANMEKPQNVIEKIVSGKMNKYYSEVVLLNQPFVMDNEITVSQLLDKYAKDLRAEVKLIDYKLLVLANNA